MSQEGRLSDDGIAGAETLTGNTGGAVGPEGAGNINVIGTGAISVAGNPGTNTLTISDDGTYATSYATDSGSAVPAAGILTVIGSGGITTSGAGSTITIAGASEQVITITSLDNTDSPYTVLTTEYYMTCNVSLGVLTINLPNAPVTGKVFIVKDAGGDAAANNITVTTVGGVVNIDGATTFVMNTAYEAAQFVFTGVVYEIF